MPAARWRTTLAGAAVLVAVAPAVVPFTSGSVASSAATGALPCGGASAHLPWQETTVPAFPGVDGITTTDRIANYSVQSNSPSRQIVTNGVTVQASTSNGCRWESSFTLEATPGPGSISGASSRITTPLLLRGGRGLLAIREGSGAASRPRVLGSPNGTGGSWAPSEAGLPAQGAPGVLTAADNGTTVYLTISPTGTTGGDDGGTGVPPLPPIGGGGGSPAPGAGLVYGSEDGGRTWAIRTAAGDLPGGDRAITAFSIDRGNDQIVFAVAGGQLLKSTDGARNFTPVPGLAGVRAIATMRPGQVAAFTENAVVYSPDSFATNRRTTAMGAITSAAYRAGDDYLAVESSGVVQLIDPRNGGTKEAPPRTRPRAGTMSGDQSGESTFHAVAGHVLIRYVDPIPPGTVPDPNVIPEGALRPDPPKPGSITPPSAQISLPDGDSRTIDYQLTLPKNPTPLDVMFLVDVSPTMSGYIEALQTNITTITNSLVKQKINVQAGVAFLTTGPRRGDPPYPEVDPANSTETNPYEKPEVYKLLRKIGPADAQFKAAIARLATRVVPSTAGLNKARDFDAAEAQVLALDQLITGSGVDLLKSQGSLLIPPNQDAGWRPDRFVRKVIVHATDQAFINNTGEWPAGSPETAEGQLNIEGTIAKLKEQGILHLGIDPGGRDAIEDLTRVSRGTGTVAPPGGAVCDPEAGTRVPAGQPLVCGQAANFGDALVSVLRSLVDLQDVSIRTTTGSNAVSNISAAKLKSVNVTVDNTLRFAVTYSCASVPPGKYLTTLETRLRGTKVASTKTNLTCIKGLAPVIKPIPGIDPPAPPPPQPLQPPGAIPPPAPPVAQPQIQPQVQIQVQVNPMTAAMLEQQQQLQLALALNSTEGPSDEKELAMVDRQSKQESSAQLLLYAAMSAASVAGVARLRTSRAHDQAVRRVR